MAYRLVIAFCVLLLCLGCSRKPQEPSGKPVIVVSIFPLESLVRQLAGDKVEVICLLPVGASSHTFEPTARQRDAVRRADLVVTIGPGIDDWAGAMAKSQRKKTSSLLCMSAAMGYQTGHEHHDHGDGDDHEHEHDHTGPNPHLWLDPVLTEKFVREHLGPAVQKLAGLPADSALADELKRLDTELADLLKPHAGGKLITYHNAFDSLAERYGLSVAATLTAVSAPGQLTSSRVNKALAVIHEHKVRTVYIEPQFPAEAANSLRNETGVAVMMLDPLGDGNDPQRDSYQNLMRYNVRMIIEGFNPPATKP